VTLAAFCPHCGSDIRLDAPIVLNEFSMFGDGYPLCYKGKPIHLTPAQSAICWTLLKAFPHVVKRDTLLIRIGSDANSNVVDVQLTRIRSKLASLDVPCPLETVHSRGYRWSTKAIITIGRGGGRKPSK
jgi:DNA-binding response OmpR family regulator